MTSTSRDSTSVYLGEIAHAAIQLRPLFREETVRRTTAALSAQAHQTLTGSGLRTRNLGAIIVSAGPGFPVHASQIAEAVSRQLAFPEPNPVGFSGRLALLEGLLFAGTAVRARRFTHVLLLHLEAKSSAEGWSIETYATVVGATRDCMQYLGVGFGNLDETASVPSGHAVGELCARLGISRPEEPDAVRWADDGKDACTLLRQLIDTGRAGARAIVGARDDDQWGAVALSVVAPREARAAPGDTSIQAHLKRAGIGEFPISFARLDVNVEGTVESASMLDDELAVLLKSAVRAFDDIRVLSRGSYLISFPRANAGALAVLRQRLESAVTGVDLAGELTVTTTFRGVAIDKPNDTTPADVEQSLGL